jgi:hypothetical protein
VATINISNQFKIITKSKKMKSYLLGVFVSLITLVFATSLYSQTCGFGGGFSTGTGPITTAIGNSNCFDRAFSIGDNATMTNLVIGGQYTVDVCGEPGSVHPPTYNSYLGIWTVGGGTFLTESLGGTCGDGNDESVTFIATATSHVIVIRDEVCGTGFSLHDLCVTYVSAPLPVELIFFQAKTTKADIQLQWQTASGLARPVSSYMVIQKMIYFI